MADSEVEDDATLMAGVATGDRDAFASLYRRRRGDVFRFALLMSGSTAVADDVAQDVFMEVIHHAGRYQPERSRVVAWLLGITRNHVLRARHRQRFVVPMEEADGSTELVVAADPLAGIARRQYVAALRRALVALPVKYREAIALCDLQEMSYADAAVSLGCAIGTVRSRLHRGRALLASKLVHREARAERGAQRRAEGWML